MNTIFAASTQIRFIGFSLTYNRGKNFGRQNGDIERMKSFNNEAKVVFLESVKLIQCRFKDTAIKKKIHDQV